MLNISLIYSRENMALSSFIASLNVSAKILCRFSRSQYNAGPGAFSGVTWTPKYSPRWEDLHDGNY